MDFYSHVFKAFNNLAEMFEYRARNDSSQIENVEFIRKLVQDGLRDYISKKAIFNIDNKDSLRLICHFGSKFKASDIKKYFEDDSFKLYILIIQEKTNLMNMKGIDGLPLNIQIFDLKELQFNITKHRFVPRHDVIFDQEEIDSIMTRFKIKSKNQLPLILKTDAMARYLNLQPGQIVKITRHSPTCGEHIIYRYCA